MQVETKKATKRKRGRPREIDYSRLCELVRVGKTDTEIAAELGVGKAAVGAARRRLGLAASGRRGRKPRVNPGEIKKQMENGKTAETLAQELSVSKKTIIRAARVAGVEVPRRLKQSTTPTPRLRRPWPWFARPRKPAQVRKLHISDYAMVTWHRTKYQYLEVNGQKTPVLVLRKEFAHAQGLPRRYNPVLGLIPGRVGRKGRGGGFVDIATRVAIQARHGQ